MGWYLQPLPPPLVCSLQCILYRFSKYPCNPPLRLRLGPQGVEADVGSLGARECADLCVALVRLGVSLPRGAGSGSSSGSSSSSSGGSGGSGSSSGGSASWLRAFVRQVELSRALTERAEHELLGEAWLRLRRASSSGGR